MDFTCTADLLSVSLPLQRVSWHRSLFIEKSVNGLSTSPHQRFTEDTPQETAVWQLQAEEAAADLDWISWSVHFNTTCKVSRREQTSSMSSKQFIAAKVCGPASRQLSVLLWIHLLIESFIIFCHIFSPPGTVPPNGGPSPIASNAKLTR